MGCYIWYSEEGTGQGQNVLCALSHQDSPIRLCINCSVLTNYSNNNANSLPQLGSYGVALQQVLAEGKDAGKSKKNVSKSTAMNYHDLINNAMPSYTQHCKQVRLMFANTRIQQTDDSELHVLSACGLDE